jgi:hypothetical protein
MKIFSQIIYLFKYLYIVYKFLWRKKGIFEIIQIILNNPVYKILKIIFNVLIIFEGILIIIYFDDIPYNLYNFSVTFDISDWFHKFYTSILRTIRDIINNLLNEEIIQETNNSDVISINKNNLDTNINNSNNTYKWWIGVIFITISGIVVYYYYTDIITYFQMDNNIPSPKTNISIIDSDNDLLNINYENITDSDSTPKASSSNLPNSDTSLDLDDLDHYFPIAN